MVDQGGRDSRIADNPSATTLSEQIALAKAVKVFAGGREGTGRQERDPGPDTT